MKNGIETQPIETLEDKKARIEASQDKSRFAIGVLSVRVRRLLDQQEHIILEAGATRGRGRRDASELLGGGLSRLHDLQKELDRIGNKKQLREEEFKELDDRLKSIEEMFTSFSKKGAEKN